MFHKVCILFHFNIIIIIIILFHFNIIQQDVVYWKKLGPLVLKTHHVNADDASFLEQRFPTFLTSGALFRINFYGGAP